MKKWLIPVIVIAVLVAGFFIIKMIFGVTVNNKAIDLEENAKNSMANVQSAYQRRNDLIGNLVKTVQGAADFERGTLTDVIEARAKATSVNVDASNLSASQIEQFQQAQTGLSSALSKLLVSVERYPELKASQNFSQLQAQIEGTENRINVARDRFNESVKEYNAYIRKFPFSFFGDKSEFEKMSMFKADAGAEEAPDVEFDFK
ncbi:LemA family protein [Zunongwangia atlantica]|uniref:LemA family protein n=1 Tax=Zunongwangia atlantica 22II14-10F7 TaxID=1185767 RepID=A0A1Y1T6F2_9FLAO|nr:LemA family protein [Zunongwangia atlantica]ORL46629.1 hypothetical protein IIF7_03896 [Zunongwangia atlantica 22II14-10F7]